MSLIVSESKGGIEYVLSPAGNHLARCYRVIDLGTQKSSWQGVEKTKRKVMIVWELHGEDSEGKPLTTADGRPLVISRRFTPSLSPKAALRGVLVSWRGRDFTLDELQGFHLKNILDKWCMLNVTHNVNESNGKIYANVKTVSSVPAMIRKAGMPDGVNELVWFDIDEPDMQVFDSFSDHLKATIQNSPEWRMRQEGAYSEPVRPQDTLEDDDDIPF